MKPWHGIIAVGVSILVSVGSVGASGVKPTSDSVYRSPSWSPDATLVVYEQATPGSHTKLLIKNMSTNQVRELATASDEIAMNPKWSPNGKKILYNDSADQIYTIWPDGSHRAVISDGDSHTAVWSPDGSQIAFVEDENSMSISRPDGSITFVEFSPGRYENVRDFVWAPDGQRILFTAEKAGSQGIFSVKLADASDGVVWPEMLAVE